MKKILLFVLAGYLLACAPTTETTTQSSATEPADANVSNAADSTDAIPDTANARHSASDSIDLPLGEFPAESDVLGTSVTLTMDQLPKAVRDAYLNMPGQENRNAVRIFQVKTSQYPVLYKIESTSTSTDNIHYYTPDGQEVNMPKFDQ